MFFFNSENSEATEPFPIWKNPIETTEKTLPRKRLTAIEPNETLEMKRNIISWEPKGTPPYATPPRKLGLIKAQLRDNGG